MKRLVGLFIIAVFFSCVKMPEGISVNGYDKIDGYYTVKEYVNDTEWSTSYTINGHTYTQNHRIYNGTEFTEIYVKPHYYVCGYWYNEKEKRKEHMFEVTKETYLNIRNNDFKYYPIDDNFSWYKKWDESIDTGQTIYLDNDIVSESRARQYFNNNYLNDWLFNRKTFIYDEIY